MCVCKGKAWPNVRVRVKVVVGYLFVMVMMKVSGKRKIMFTSVLTTIVRPTCVCSRGMWIMASKSF